MRAKSCLLQARKLRDHGTGPDWDLNLRAVKARSETWVNPWPQALDMPGSARCVRLACGAKHTLFLTATGQLYGCGQNAQRQLSSAVSGCVTTTELPFSHENGLPVDIFCHPSLNVSVVLTKENRFFICGEAGSLFHTAGLIEHFLPYDRDAIMIENRIVCMKHSTSQVYIPGFNDPKVGTVELVAAQEAEEPEPDGAYASRLLERHLAVDSLRRLTHQALEGGSLTPQDVIKEYAGASVGPSPGVADAAKATASAPNSGDMADLGGLARGERTYDVQVIFGDRRAEHYRAIARSLIEVVAQKSSKPILLGIQLKEHNVQVFRAILQQLRDKIGPVVAVEEVDEFADFEGQGSLRLHSQTLAESRAAKKFDSPTFSVHVGLDTIKVRSQYLWRLLESPCKGNVTRHEDGRYTVRIHKYSYEALLAYGQYLHEDRVDCRPEVAVELLELAEESAARQLPRRVFAWLNSPWMAGWLDGWMAGWLAAWLAGWLDGWMDGWVDVWMYACMHFLHVWELLAG
eukprot:s695_g13.t3